MRTLFALFACLFLFACQRNENDSVDEKITTVSMPSSASVAYAAAEAVPIVPTNESPDQPIEQKIIRDATLRFETSDMDETYARTISAAKKYGAQIQNDSETKEYNAVNRHLTVRIPNQHFDAFLADVGKGVTYFDQKEISSTDVTEEFIDVDARLKAKKKLEARYLELLGKAAKVSEMLEIERELANVREEIEAKEGRLRYMKNHIALSTFNIDFYKTLATDGGATVSFGSKIWNAVKTGFNSISVFFIELLNNWPIILILVVLILWLRRKFRKRKNP
jgi:hypothetical protein